MTLEADRIIDVWDIDTGKVIAQYEGLEVHHSMRSIAQLNEQIDELWARLAAVQIAQLRSLGFVDGDEAL
jgi:hypothetical protein